jgi:hypothetical protein
MMVKLEINIEARVGPSGTPYLYVWGNVPILTAANSPHDVGSRIEPIDTVEYRASVEDVTAVLNLRPEDVEKARQETLFLARIH